MSNIFKLFYFHADDSLYFFIFLSGGILVQTQNKLLILPSKKEQLFQEESFFNSISQKVLQNFVAKKTFGWWNISEHCITVCKTCLQILVCRSQHSFGFFFWVLFISGNTYRTYLNHPAFCGLPMF